jgi:hypothetical protein
MHLAVYAEIVGHGASGNFASSSTSSRRLYFASRSDWVIEPTLV